MIKYTLLFLLSLSLVSCFDDEETLKPDLSNAAGIIIEARTITYRSLPPAVREKAHDASLYQFVGNAPVYIDKKNGSYLRLVVNNKFLAEYSHWDKHNKESDLLDSSNFYALYGKYRNRPELFNSAGKEIAITQKHEGYNLISIIRDKQIDTTYWGPLQETPAKLVLNCALLDSAHQPTVQVIQ